MKYTQRSLELNNQFQLGTNIQLLASNIEIQFHNFTSSYIEPELENYNVSFQDKTVSENTSFVYPVFKPKNRTKSNKAILLLHGLNERSWSKYLTWAEYLCEKTDKTVVLFPLAFHMNRSPQSWWNPRDLKTKLELRRLKNGEDRALSFANLTFSERICEQPYRFYNSGKQSLNDLNQLVSTIKNGSHPTFSENTEIDIFAYSIGAFLAEITMMTNYNQLFSDSKLFLFCGGGVFSAMFGKSRCIMDNKAYEQLFDYYQHKFSTETKNTGFGDKAIEWFNCMISPERSKVAREQFFSKMRNKLSGISLLNDKVMPYYGIAEALGQELADTKIKQLDFNFDYSHENPFPIGKFVDAAKVDIAFATTFDEASDFLR